MNEKFKSIDEDPYKFITHIKKQYKFDNFIVDKHNEMARDAAYAISYKPVGKYPLFIYGGTSLGKTHLLQAIANRIITERTDFKVIYITGEQFTNAILDSMFVLAGSDARHKGNCFRQAFCDAEMLIIDDIQSIANKKVIQEEFLHVYDRLTSMSKQIIISSNKPPSDIPALDEKLKARFSSGLIFELLPPSMDAKIAILKNKIKDMRCSVPDEVLTILAQKSEDNIRGLIGKLKKVVFASELYQMPVSVSLVEKVLN